jgi:hypothetical protein
MTFADALTCDGSAPGRALGLVDYDSLDVLLADTRDDPEHLLE